MQGSKTKLPTPRGERQRWRLRVHLPRVTLADGRRSQRYLTETFRGTAKEADERLRVMCREVEGIDTAEGVRTFAQALDHWRRVDAARLSPTTVRGYEMNLARHVVPVFGKLKLSKITTHRVESFYGDLARAGMTPRTVHQVHSALSAVLSTATRLDWLARNPAHGTKRPTLTKWHPPVAVDDDVIAKLLDETVDDPDFRAVLLVAIGSGARRGEIVGLRWSDVDLDTGRLRIARAVVHAHEKGNGETKGRLAEKGTKTHAQRWVVLPSYAVEALRARRARAEADAACFETTLDADGYVFSDEPRGRRPWRPDFLTSRFVRARRAAKVGSVRFHDLRHYAASSALANGATTAAVRDLLGHGSISTTDRYVHAPSSALDEIAARADLTMRRVMGA